MIKEYEKDANNKKLWKKENLGRGELILSNILRMLFGCSIVYSLYKHELSLIPVASVSLFLTFIPVIMEKSVKVSLPASFQVVLLIFIFAAQFLGEIVNYYDRYWWWDIMLHSWSGVLLGTIGFLLVYILNDAKSVNVFMSPVFISFFSLCFALTCGAVWEIFEFMADLIFGTNMQKSGLFDTMGDIIVDFIGALIVSINGYFTLRDNKKTFLSKALYLFFNENPDISNNTNAP